MENEEDSPGLVPFTDHEIQKSDPQSFVLEQAVDTIVDNNAHVERKQVDSPADGDENESAEVTQDWATDAEDDEQQPLSFELQEGWKILDYFLRKADSNLTEHFMDAVDNRFPETQNYYDKIKEPIWLTLSKYACLWLYICIVQASDDDDYKYDKLWFFWATNKNRTYIILYLNTTEYA